MQKEPQQYVPETETISKASGACGDVHCRKKRSPAQTAQYMINESVFLLGLRLRDSRIEKQFYTRFYPLVRYFAKKYLPLVAHALDLEDMMQLLWMRLYKCLMERTIKNVVTTQALAITALQRACVDITRHYAKTRGREILWDGSSEICAESEDETTGSSIPNSLVHFDENGLPENFSDLAPQDKNIDFLTAKLLLERYAKNASPKMAALLKLILQDKTDEEIAVNFHCSRAAAGRKKNMVLDSLKDFFLDNGWKDEQTHE